MQNELYYGDNLDVLRRKIAPESVDLCYIDPPFNSKRNYFQIYNNQGSEDRAQAFVDTWNWGEEAIEGLEYILDLERLNPRAGETRWTEQTVELIRGLEKVLGRGSLLAYLVHMTLRIVEIHRVLKPTGSFYLHCDPTASHYLKLVCDAVFCGQGGDFLNEIIWRRTGSHNSAKRFGPIHDVILFYAKSSNYKIYPYFRPYLKGHVAGYFKKRDENGLYWTNSIHGAGLRNGVSGQPWRGYDPTAAGRHWAVPSDLVLAFGIDPDLPQHQKLDALADLGVIDFPQDGSGALPTYRQDLERSPGMPLGDIWAYQPHTRGVLYGSDEAIDEDVRWLNAQGDKERLGYPTQKPEGLLERIISSSTIEGDTVLDAYCGCGTTVAVAQRLKRRWIGIDITYQSIALILKRFRDPFGGDEAGWQALEATIKLDGIPRDLASAIALANRKDDKTRKEFEKWAVLTYSDNQARINEKKGGDGGIDGIGLFFIDKDTNGRCIIQVKSGKTGPRDLRDLMGTMQREKAEVGVLICMDLPTKAMRDEMTAAGKYVHPTIGREYDRLQVVTIAEMFPDAANNRPARRLDLPWARTDTVKKAAAKGDADKQGSLL